MRDWFILLGKNWPNNKYLKKYIKRKKPRANSSGTRNTLRPRSCYCGAKSQSRNDVSRTNMYLTFPLLLWYSLRYINVVLWYYRTFVHYIISNCHYFVIATWRWLMRRYLTSMEMDLVHLSNACGATVLERFAWVLTEWFIILELGIPAASPWIMQNYFIIALAVTAKWGRTLMRQRFKSWHFLQDIICCLLFPILFFLFHYCSCFRLAPSIS